MKKRVKFRAQSHKIKLLVLPILMALISCEPDVFAIESGQTAVNSAIAQKEAAVTDHLPAFPGAEGFGAKSTGGRGGRVIEVTNLNDSGPGSLRAAIDADGSRIVVFRTGGTIELKSSLEISNPYITIAGQTAPGSGVTLRNHPSNRESSMWVKTHDVIIRYLTIRPGPSQEKSSNVDALTIGNSDGGTFNVIIDHVSTSWATDEVIMTWYDAHDITIQWSIISEGLNCSTHEKGCHSMGMLIGSDGSRNISIHHNLFAHNQARNPRINPSGLVEVVNNVIYNPGGTASVVVDDYDKAQVSYIANYFKRGPASSPSKHLVTGKSTNHNGIEVFAQGNITPHRPIDFLPEWLAVKPEARQWIVQTLQDESPITTVSALEAYKQVLANAGATIGLTSQGDQNWRRDAVDDRIVSDVKNGTGRIIDDPSEVGGWLELAPGTPYKDSDHDGMPDEWEVWYGFDPNDPTDGSIDADGDGYTNIEEYLNSTDPFD